MSITAQKYGTLESGKEVQLFTLKNKNELSVEITNYGGIITKLFTPDANGNFADIVLGKDSLNDYLSGHPHFGAITGRVAGRIGGAEFSIDGKAYSLEKNNGNNCLHGGSKGYDKQLWSHKIIKDLDVEKLQLTHKDLGEENGFPGQIECSVTYALLEDNTLEIIYTAATNATTPFNPTNHSYFNLDGAGSGEIVNHTVQIFSDAIAAVDSHSTLTGEKKDVEIGFNDYRSPVILSSLSSLETNNADIHFFLENGRTTIPKPAAILTSPKSGRKMEVFTTEPGVQFYAGLSLSNEAPETGKGDVIYGPKTGLCFETQDYADSVNFPKMGNAMLAPSENFRSITLYRFSTV